MSAAGAALAASDHAGRCELWNGYLDLAFARDYQRQQLPPTVKFGEGRCEVKHGLTLPRSRQHGAAWAKREQARTPAGWVTILRPQIAQAVALGGLRAASRPLQGPYRLGVQPGLGRTHFQLVASAALKTSRPA